MTSALRTYSTLRLLSLLLLAAIASGYSICGLATLAHTERTKADHHATGQAHDHADGDADHCCTVFAAQMGTALREQPVRVLDGPLVTVGILPTAVFAILPPATTSAPVPAPAFRFSSRSSPPTPSRAPPLCLLG